MSLRARDNRQNPIVIIGGGIVGGNAAATLQGPGIVAHCPVDGLVRILAC
jgi:hypothetical protein